MAGAALDRGGPVRPITGPWAARPYGQPVRAFWHGELGRGGHGRRARGGVRPGPPRDRNGRPRAGERGAGRAGQPEGPRTDGPQVCLPGARIPQCAPPVRGRGWRLGDSDVFMASDPGLLDPRRAVAPTPAAPDRGEH